MLLIVNVFRVVLGKDYLASLLHGHSFNLLFPRLNNLFFGTRLGQPSFRFQDLTTEKVLSTKKISATTNEDRCLSPSDDLKNKFTHLNHLTVNNKKKGSLESDQIGFSRQTSQKEVLHHFQSKSFILPVQREYLIFVIILQKRGNNVRKGEYIKFQVQKINAYLVTV